MANKGNNRHLKRMAAPRHLNIARKEKQAGRFFLKANPGPHAIEQCLPLGHIIRDILKLADSMREVRHILTQKTVFVDGILRTDRHFPVGLMDVLEIREINKLYRILPSHKYGLTVSEITQDEAQFKLCKILDISAVKHGNFQLHLHDGRNILLKTPDPTKKPDFPYKTGGSVKISIPDQKILEYLPLAENAQGIIYQGKNVGISGAISHLSKRFGVNASLAQVKTEKGEEINTAYNYVFIVGKTQPAIDLPLEE